ncbi:MAG TPA: (2Fe-2S) ferredoxin domain-containing protein [Methylotenera sp.]|nr:(2Fe-2S) ferredoxin domain-containing protein [Methylotenera sp.]HPV44940.1 (2Fe-2S) ferredoxin domain-containing protein [Methylotenera sp.]
MVKKILVCTNYRANPNHPSCAARGSKEAALELTRQLQGKNVKIEIEESPCMGFCNIGPNMRLIPGGEFFHEVSDKKIAEIIKAVKIFLKT